VTPTWALPEGEAPTGRYAWGGFRIVSNLDLPRLWRTQADPNARFRWRFEPAPRAGKALRRDEIRTQKGERVSVTVLKDQTVRYKIQSVGLYEVHAESRAIDFFASPGADPMNTEHFLINAVLPIYAGLLTEVCLHASAVAPDGRATIFAGPSGSGKSTKALEVIGRGGILLGDDSVVLRRRDDAWLVYPGARTMRLEEPPPGPSWRSGPKYEWFVASAKDPLPLGELVVLDGGGEAAEAAFAGSGLLRALLSLQPGWVWGDIRTRRAVADQTAALCYRLISSTPSPAGPTAPPVRSHTLPSGSSVGASYESGQRSSTGRPL
jgi:hypothetical protein